MKTQLYFSNLKSLGGEFLGHLQKKEVKLQRTHQKYYATSRPIFHESKGHSELRKSRLNLEIKFIKKLILENVILQFVCNPQNYLSSPGFTTLNFIRIISYYTRYMSRSSHLPSLVRGTTPLQRFFPRVLLFPPSSLDNFLTVLLLLTPSIGKPFYSLVTSCLFNRRLFNRRLFNLLLLLPSSLDIFSDLFLLPPSSFHKFFSPLLLPPYSLLFFQSLVTYSLFIKQYFSSNLLFSSLFVKAKYPQQHKLKRYKTSQVSALRTITWR